MRAGIRKRILKGYGRGRRRAPEGNFSSIGPIREKALAPANLLSRRLGKELSQSAALECVDWPELVVGRASEFPTVGTDRAASLREGLSATESLVRWGVSISIGAVALSSRRSFNDSFARHSISGRNTRATSVHLSRISHFRAFWPGKPHPVGTAGGLTERGLQTDDRGADEWDWQSGTSGV